jgi:uncharacterized protein (AIM24 family)
MNEATVLLLDHNRNEIMVRNDAFLVAATILNVLLELGGRISGLV